MNFNFSGMFGGGFTNNLNKNNFDFSAFAPKQEEPVNDPIDIVSNNTPEAKVEVLEGAADVAITKQPEIKYSPAVTNVIAPTTPDLMAVPADPITDAIQSVQTAESPTANYSNMTWEDLEEQRLSGGDFSLGKDFVALDQASREADSTDQGLLFEAGLGEDLRQDYDPNNQFTTGAMGEVTRSGQQADFKNLIDQGTVNRLAEQGLQANYAQDKYKGYRYNPTTGEYDYYDNTPSAIEQAAPALIKAGVIAAATAGLGSALAGSSAVTGVAGANTALANGIGYGIASGASTAIQGGDTGDILKSAALGGLGGYTKGLDTLTADAEYMLGLADEGAELASHAETMNMVMDGVDLVTAIDEKDVLGALEAGLSLGGMPSTTELVSDKLLDTFNTSTFVNRNSDVLASVGIKAAIDIGQGADAKEVIQNATNNTIKELVVTENNVSRAIQDFVGDSEFVANNLDAITKTAMEATGAILDGESRDKIIGKTVETYIKEGGQLTPDLGGGANILDSAEDWYHENIENPLEEFWQDIEPTRKEIEDVVGGSIDIIKDKIVKPAVETVKTVVKEADQVVRDLPTTKEVWETFAADTKQGILDTAEQARVKASEANRFVQREIIDEVQGFLSEQNQTFQTALEPIKEDFSKLNQTVRTELANFDKDYLQPVKNDISQINKDVRIQLAAFDDETLQPIKKDIEDVITKVDTTLSAFNKDYIKPIDERLSQTNKDVRDQLANFDKDYLQPIKNDLSENNKAFQGKVDEIQLALSETNKGFRDELSGFEDTYLNPIKEDVKGLAGDLKTGLSETNENFRQGLSDFEDDYLQPIKGDIESLAGDLKTGLSDTNKYIRDQLAGFNDDALQPIKNEIEDLIGGIDGLDVDMSGVKDMLSSVWDALGGLTTGLAATQEAAGKPSGNLGELAKMNTQYGEQYQFEDIRNNSLLNNELFS